MANPTSAFGWQMPTSTDLVTDLPADFEVFGQAVDTSLADLKGGTTGQVLSKATNADMDFTWVTTDDANAIQNSIVDAKGDLIAASANDTPARLAVGANDTMLVADSTTATGLAYKSATTFYPWTSWTPSISGITLGNGTTTARSQKIGKTVHFSFILVFGSTTSVTARINFSLPYTPKSNSLCVGWFDNYTALFSIAAPFVLTNGLCYVDAVSTSGSYAENAPSSSTVPFVLGTLDSIVVTGTFEEA